MAIAERAGSCREGVFQYIVKDSGGASPIGFGVSSDTLLFAVAVDGALVVQQGHRDSGMLFIVPFSIGSATKYYRFPAVPGKASGLR